MAGTIAYEAPVFILLPIAGFIGELWEKHFKDNALSACANWFKGYVSGSTRGFEGRYRQRIILGHEVFNEQGIRVEDRARVLKLEMVLLT